MAPEQWNGEKVDARADVFSLGVVLYELVTGALPHVGASPFAVQQAILERKRRRPSDVAEVPAALEATIEKALAPAPGGRFAGTGDLARELEAILAGKTGDEAWSGRAKRAALLAAPLVLLLALGLVLARHDGRAPDRAPPPPAPPPRVANDAERARAHDARALALRHVADARFCIKRQNDDGALTAVSMIEDPGAITSEEATSLARDLVGEVAAIASRVSLTYRDSRKGEAGQAYRLCALALRFDPGAVDGLSPFSGALVAEGFGQIGPADWNAEPAPWAAKAALADHLLRLAPEDAAFPVAHWLASKSDPPDPARARAFARRVHELRPLAPIVLVVQAEAAWLWPGKEKDAAVARDFYEHAIRATSSGFDGDDLNPSELSHAKKRLAEIREAKGR